MNNLGVGGSFAPDFISTVNGKTITLLDDQGVEQTVVVDLCVLSQVYPARAIIYYGGQTQSAFIDLLELAEQTSGLAASPEYKAEWVKIVKQVEKEYAAATPFHPRHGGPSE